ncbi:hypothetical protein [Tenacibaculum maritimum]|uniref:hypothetical protein n=1 Tax=Tenacibaculum maritimum TaxID=107401 RepID=UPI001E32F940|nr:hypothetical protein [Tenacibaculum maritimum]MCD9580610.1 hypothetical protein [Tenacibaculum maritimum]MCD9634491.1 hypothetical protein [Tenacibaculum maritimum]
MSDKKFKHLDYIHNTINRMSNNSFLIKGWTISIVSVLFVFSDDKMNGRFLGIAIIAVVIFWYLNGFFLQQERKFRALYDKVRIQQENEVDFSMSTTDFKDGKYSLLSSIFGKTIWPLYLTIIFMIIIAKYILESTVANNV